MKDWAVEVGEPTTWRFPPAEWFIMENYPKIDALGVPPRIGHHHVFFFELTIVFIVGY